MLNVFFWMFIVFTTAVLINSKWVSDAAEKRERVIVERVTHVEGSANRQGRTAEVERMHSIDETQTLRFFTIPRRDEKITSSGFLLYTPEEEKPCEIYNMEGDRVA